MLLFVYLCEVAGLPVGELSYRTVEAKVYRWHGLWHRFCLAKSGGLGGEWDVCQKRTFSTQLLGESPFCESLAA
jgi:hypothetical protein